MKRTSRRTLERIFSHPVSANIPWRDIEALLAELGADISEREGSRVGVRLFGEWRVFHRPYPSPNTDKGAASLKVFLEMCEEDDVEPGRHYSGKFNVRIAPELHASIAAAAAAEGKSLNQWVADTFSTHV